MVDSDSEDSESSASLDSISPMFMHHRVNPFGSLEIMPGRRRNFAFEMLPAIMGMRQRQRRGPRPFMISSGEDFMSGIELLMQALGGDRSESHKKLRKELPGRPYEPSKEEENCSICICPLEKGESSVRLRCRHVYHQACINQWGKESAICPQCREEIHDE